jgi:alpha-L-fucosidase
MTVPPAGTELKIVSLGTDAKLLSSPIQSVALLGSGQKIEWSQRDGGLFITLPKEMPFKTAIGFKITASPGGVVSSPGSTSSN